MTADDLTDEELAFEFEKMAYGKTCWLADFSEGRKKRPDHQISDVRRQLKALKQAAARFRAVAERRKAG